MSAILVVTYPNGPPAYATSAHSGTWVISIGIQIIYYIINNIVTNIYIYTHVVGINFRSSHVSYQRFSYNPSTR